MTHKSEKFLQISCNFMVGVLREDVLGNLFD